MVVIWTALLAASLVIATVLIHYEVLRATSRFVTSVAIAARSRILLVLVGIFIAHLLEVSLYAFAYLLMSDHFGLGSVRGMTGGGFVDFFYFSITCYTTLGLGDVFPSGAMRIVAGIEALNGFVLIGWSTSFTYLAMERFWKEADRPPTA
jgi:hypothetical protein